MFNCCGQHTILKDDVRSSSGRCPPVVHSSSARCPPVVHSSSACCPTFWTEVFICRRVFLQYGKSLLALVRNDESKGFKPNFFLKNNCFCVFVGENNRILPSAALLSIILWTVLPNRAVSYEFLGTAGEYRLQLAVRNRLQTAVRNCWELFFARSSSPPTVAETDDKKMQKFVDNQLKTSYIINIVCERTTNLICVR